MSLNENNTFCCSESLVTSGMITPEVGQLVAMNSHSTVSSRFLLARTPPNPSYGTYSFKVQHLQSQHLLFGSVYKCACCAWSDSLFGGVAVSSHGKTESHCIIVKGWVLDLCLVDWKLGNAFSTHSCKHSLSLNSVPSFLWTSLVENGWRAEFAATNVDDPQKDVLFLNTKVYAAMENI